MERWLLPLVVVAGALGAGLPGPGRRADAADAVLITLAVLVFCTGTSMTFGQLGVIASAWRRLALVVVVSTVVLPVLAWLASHLVTGTAARGGILAAGVAPSEVASVALTGLAAGETALAVGLLAISTCLTVLLAGPVLRLAGARPAASPLGLLGTLALVVALPLAAGVVLRSLAGARRGADTRRGADAALAVAGAGAADGAGAAEGADGDWGAAGRVLGAVSLLVLLWEVASQLKLGAGEVRVLAALLVYLAGSAVLGVLLGLGAPPERRIPILLPVAMRDFAVGAGIADSAFGTAAAAPLGLYGLLVLVFGTAAAAVLRRRVAAG